jgi:hypothetical protein
MTVPSATRSVTYTGNGATTAFAVPFVFLDKAHLVATRTAAEVASVLAEGSDYTVTGAGSPSGGALTLAVALADGASLKIERVVPLTQSTSFRTQGTFSPALHEAALDLGVMAAQQLSAALEEGDADLQAQVDAINSDIITGSGGDPNELEVSATGSNTPRKLKDRFADVFRVKDYGAVGDGVADDTSKVSDCQDAAGGTNPAIIHFEAGTYLLSGNGLLVRAASGSVYRGAGMRRTALKAAAGITNWLAQSSGSYIRQDITFEDLTFDTDGKGLGALVVYGAHVQGLTFRRCRFLCNGNLGAILNAVAGVSFEDCVFHGYGSPSNTALQVTNGSERVALRRCRFVGFGNSVLVDTGSSSTAAVDDLSSHFTVEGCHFDGLWYARPAIKSNSGATVTYSPTVLTDSAGGFNAIGLAAFNRVRVLTSRRTGTFTEISGTYLKDSGANWASAGALRGEIVRSGSKFAFVAGRDETDNTRLNVEEWLDATTFLPVAPPATGAAYTALKLLTGAIASWTDTALTTYDGFYDLSGDAATPDAGDLYEVFKPGVYNLHVEYGARNVRVSGNTFLRGWADQCSIYCNRATIVDNLVEFGQDMGITLNGTPGDGYSVVARNRVFQQGVAGIFVGSCEHGLVSHNVIAGASWTNHVNQWTIGGIQLAGCSDMLVSDNQLDGQGRTLARAGIAIHADEVECADVLVQGNRCQGFSLGGIVLYGTLVSGLKLRENRATIAHAAAGAGAGAGTAAGGDYGTLYHSDLGVTGTPEGEVVAGVGTEYVASTGARYFKATGTSDTGWVVLSGANTGDLSLASAGATPNASGASLSGQELTLQPASGSHPGIVSTGAQTIAGAKTFSGAATFGSTLDSSANLVVPNAGNPGATTNYNGRLKRFTLSRTITKDSFKAAATQEDLLLFQLPAKTKLLSIIVDTTEAWAGSGTVYDMKLGTASNGEQLVVNHSVLAAVTKGLDDADLGTSINRANAVQGGLLGSWTDTWNIYVRLASDANLGDGSATGLTTGITTIYLEYSSF